MMGIQDPPQGKLTYTHFNLGQRIRANYPLGEKGRKRGHIPFYSYLILILGPPWGFKQNGGTKRGRP